MRRIGCWVKDEAMDVDLFAAKTASGDVVRAEMKIPESEPTSPVIFLSNDTFGKQETSPNRKTD